MVLSSFAGFPFLLMSADQIEQKPTFPINMNTIIGSVA
jgi:hypothetical protein